MENNEKRAYIIQATPEQMAQIRYAIFTNLSNDTQDSYAALSAAKPLGLEALRLVVEAARRYSNNATDFALDEAIAKIEAIFK